MGKPRRSQLEEAALALSAMLTAVVGAVQGTVDRARSDSKDRELDKGKSAAPAIPIPRQSPGRCPPDRGRLVARRWFMSDISRDYQTRVTGFAPYTEWEFETIEFDGFSSPECRLQEAKARYDQFFDKKTARPKPFFSLFGVPRMLDQARRQSAVVRINAPAKLTWYFMQPVSHKYFSTEFAAEALPIESLLHP